MLTFGVSADRQYTSFLFFGFSEHMRACVFEQSLWRISQTLKNSYEIRPE